MEINEAWNEASVCPPVCTRHHALIARRMVLAAISAAPLAVTVLLGCARAHAIILTGADRRPATSTEMGRGRGCRS